MRFLILLAVLPLWAADDADAILQRFIAAQRQNDEKAKNYTFVEEAVWFSRNKDGELHQLRSEAYENIFIEGGRYRKVIAHNGKPIDRKEQASVEADMTKVAEERRSHPYQQPSGGKISNGKDNAELGTNQELLTLFTNSITGEEEIGGRKAWVIECAPKTDRDPANQHEKDVRNFAKKLWIDEADNVMLRALFTVTGDGIFAKPGSTITIELQKVNQEVWQPSLLALEFLGAKTALAREPRTEYHYSKFQKFDVQSTITMDK